MADNDDYFDDDQETTYSANDYWGPYYAGLYMRDRDVDGALSKMMMGRDRALAQGELRVAFYMNHWIMQTILFKKQDYAEAYELAVKTAAESQKPIYEGMQERICVFQDLILVHLGIDPLGYEDLIEQAIQEMNQRITRPVNCMFCMQDLRCTFEIARGDLDSAEQHTLRFLSMSEDKGDRRHYGVAAQALMCMITHQRGEWQRLLDTAMIGDQWARASTSMVDYPSFFSACLALAHRKLGNESEARRYYRIAASQASGTIPDELHSYFDVMCDYHEMAGDLQAAANLREREMAEITGRGQLHREARVGLEAARYRKQLGQPIDEQVAAVEAVLPRLKKPEALAAQLAQLRGS